MGRSKTPSELRARSWALVELLRAGRKQHGWSQAELARRSGIGVDTIRAVEQGTRPNLAFFTVATWAKSVGIPLEELEAAPVEAPKPAHDD